MLKSEITAPWKFHSFLKTLVIKLVYPPAQVVPILLNEDIIAVVALISLVDIVPFSSDI